jgi:tetratricopeptide (TPR) repeat protein
MQEYEQVLTEAKRLASDDQASELVKAQAYQLWGDALAQGPARAFDEALKQHTEAIKLAEALSLNTVGPVRITAKDLLVDAHLAIANDIAWGNWQKKADVVPKWIDRANAFCTSMIEQNQADESIRFRVHTKALQAYAGMKDAPEIGDTVDAMNKLGAELLEAETIEARKQMIAWSLGEAMTNAMAVAQAQGNADAATQFGQQALLQFERSGRVGENWPGRSTTVGKLYYRLGAIQAISHTDHTKALAWYEKAVPLLESPAPASASADPGRLGEMFVSIAVSHWEAGNREEAVRLTQEGASLMETAVAKNLLSQAALGVPYGNLASMHAEMGNANQSEQFASKAAKLETARR